MGRVAQLEGEATRLGEELAEARSGAGGNGSNNAAQQWEELARLNTQLKDRNEELELLVLAQAERGR